MDDKKRYCIIGIIVSTLLITFLHFSLFQEQSPHIVLEEFYYIPLVLGALLFGLKGALLTYLLVSLLYLPFFFGSWTTTFLGLVDRLLHLLFSGLFAFIAGFLADRERRHQRQLAKERYLANIGEVATTIVHDLKNPLITILGFSRRILEGKGDANTAAQTITEAAQTMQKIVHDILDFSKPIQLELKENDIKSVIKQASDSCKIKAEERGVVLTSDVPDNPLNIMIDSFQIQRALVNLINNAIEASDKGQKVTITVETKKKYLFIKIKDRGTGMDDETLENIFTPFYTKKSGGTGFGMSIAKKIIEGHKGKISVDSYRGRGTEATIKLSYKRVV